MTNATAAPSVAPSARPRLRDDVVWLESDGGVYVRSAHTAFVLRGRSTYQLMSLLTPHLTGERTLGELCTGMSPAQSSAVTKLVQVLLDRGMVRDLHTGDDTVLPAPVARRFADQLAFLGQFVDDPATRLATFRNASVSLTGDGHALHAAATGLLRNGLGRLRLSPAHEPYVDDIRSCATALDATVVISDDIDVDRCDIVVYCADEPDLGYVRRLSHRCVAAGVRFLPAVLSPQRAVLGPLWRPGSPGCWTCLQLRLAANDPADVTAAAWRGMVLGTPTPAAPPVSETVSRMIGNAAAFDVFRELTGALPPDTHAAVVVQNQSTLETSTAALVAHPHCPACGGPDPSRAALAPDASDEERYERLSRLVDPTVGVLQRFDDDALRQSPLPTARLRVGPPAGHPGGPRDIVAFDVETVMRARLHTMREALGYYADRLAGVPVRVNRAEELDAPAVLPRQLATWAGLRDIDAGTRLAWVPATSLRTGAAHYLPAAAVFPHSAWNREHMFERTPAGIGVDVDASAATLAGLTGALAYQTLDALIRGGATVADLDPAGLGDDAYLSFLRDCLRHLGQRPVLRLVHAGGPVHVVLAGVDDPARPRWQVGAALTRDTALGAALRDLLGSTQFTAYHGDVPDLGDPLMPDLPTRVEPNVPAVPADAIDNDALLAHVAGSGYDAWCVATTPADLASVGGYQTARVVLGSRPGRVAAHSGGDT